MFFFISLFSSQLIHQNWDNKSKLNAYPCSVDSLGFQFYAFVLLSFTWTTFLFLPYVHNLTNHKAPFTSSSSMKPCLTLSTGNHPPFIWTSITLNGMVSSYVYVCILSPTLDHKMPESKTITQLLERWWSHSNDIRWKNNECIDGYSFKYKVTGGHKHRQHHNQRLQGQEAFKEEGHFQRPPCLCVLQVNAHFTAMWASEGKAAPGPHSKLHPQPLQHSNWSITDTQ